MDNRIVVRPVGMNLANENGKIIRKSTFQRNNLFISCISDALR